MMKMKPCNVEWKNKDLNYKHSKHIFDQKNCDSQAFNLDNDSEFHNHV